MIELFYPEGAIHRIPAPNAQQMREVALGLSDNDEQFPVVEPSGLVIGKASRTYCHSGAKPLHPVVHLHIVSRDSELFLQKRSASKKIQPSKWDTAVGGHVSFGESIGEALLREAFEELSLRDFCPIYLDSYVFESEIEKELVNVFAIVGNQFNINVDPEEIADGRFWSFNQVDEALESGQMTPNFVSEYRVFRDRLLSLL